VTTAAWLPNYDRQIKEWTNRGCTAWATSKRELENYLHPSAIRSEAAGYTGKGEDFEDVPALFAEAVHSAAPATTPWATLPEEKRRDKISAAKRKLNTECVGRMTPELLKEVDRNDDIRTWLRAIEQALR
jgi:hypothetical protein